MFTSSFVNCQKSERTGFKGYRHKYAGFKQLQQQLIDVGLRIISIRKTFVKNRYEQRACFYKKIKIMRIVSKHTVWVCSAACQKIINHSITTQ